MIINVKSKEALGYVKNTLNDTFSVDPYFKESLIKHRFFKDMPLMNNHYFNFEKSVNNIKYIGDNNEE